jgi:hypothetical protein
LVRRLDVGRVQIDFSDVQDFDVLDEGEYPVVISKAEFRPAREEGKFPYINLELDLTEEPNKGRKLWMILSFSPKALWRMKDVFENLGIYDDAMEVDYDEESMLVTQPALAGLPATAVVTHREWEGRTQTQVDALISSDNAPAKASGKKKFQ